MKASIVTTQYGNEIDLSAAAAIMDREISEEVHALNLSSDQEWYDEYCRRHAAQYGEEFEADKLNGNW